MADAVPLQPLQSGSRERSVGNAFCSRAAVVLVEAANFFSARALCNAQSVTMCKRAQVHLHVM
jgi:hypothetical protein